MNVPENAIELAKYFEGFYAKAYLCPALKWTIGYGHLCSKDHPLITEAIAEDYLANDLQDALAGTVRICPILLSTDKLRLGAVVDFVFNLGVGRLQSSTLRRRINAGQWEDVPMELNKWVYGGGRKLRGLVLRRQAESAYFS